MSTPTPAALVALVKNAGRHLVEANQHYAGQRYASAVASAIFAIEETGKLSLILSGADAPKSNKRHAMHARGIYAISVLAENWHCMTEWQSILRNGWTPNSTLTELQQTMLAVHPEYSEFVRRLQAGDLLTVEERTQAFAVAIAARMERDGSNARWQPVVEQGLNQRRIRATYVDVTETGFTSPEATSAEEAHALCFLALVLMSLIFAVAIGVGPLKGYEAELAKLFPNYDLDVIGGDEITQFVRAFSKTKVGQEAK